MKEEKEDAKFFVTKFWPKLIERLQIAFVSMNNGTDINEQDLDIIKAQHELYHTGRIEFDNLSSMDFDVNVVSQGMLFGDKLSDNVNGIDVEYDRT